jgi:thiamine-phosphate pyrophosphorylase
MEQNPLIAALRLYLVADPEHTDGDLVAVVEAALLGGVSCVQLRAKSLSDVDHFRLAVQIRDACARTGALFVVNDRIDIALAAGAGGVHLGVDDLPIEAARALGGTEFVIGYSPAEETEVAKTGFRGADYLGVGPVYGTKTKLDAGAAIGIETLKRRVVAAAIPVVAIGGITVENAAAAMAAGATGVAVVSAILRAGDPRTAAAALRSAVDTL